MSEPTREEKLKTIRVANRIIYNKLQEMAPDIKDFSENVDYLAAIFKAPTPQPQPRPITPAIPETPEDRAKFQALLAELKSK